MWAAFALIGFIAIIALLCLAATLCAPDLDGSGSCCSQNCNQGRDCDCGERG